MEKDYRGRTGSKSKMKENSHLDQNGGPGKKWVNSRCDWWVKPTGLLVVWIWGGIGMLRETVLLLIERLDKNSPRGMSSQEYNQLCCLSGEQGKLSFH